MYLGKTENNISVAIKFSTGPDKFYKQEMKCYDKLEALTNMECLKYGVPFIYHTDIFYNYKTIVMTNLDTDLQSLHRRIGTFSKDSILIVFRDAVI